eukprot:SAG11_NODE_2012_length_3924_cov_1.906667_2_plen_74_part_00
MEPNDFNIKAGVEFAFMSATLDREVAEKYCKGPADRPSIVFQMRQVRGAWLTRLWVRCLRALTRGAGCGAREW